MQRINLFFKQYFCNHAIANELKVNNNPSILIVSAIIQCTKCQKTYPLPNNYPCCYITHLQAEMLKEQFIQMLGKTNYSYPQESLQRLNQNGPV